jgi:hypothetical protein
MPAASSSDESLLLADARAGGRAIDAHSLLQGDVRTETGATLSASPEVDVVTKLWRFGRAGGASGSARRRPCLDLRSGSPAGGGAPG